MRNQGLDVIRGWLIVLVIVGHLVLGSAYDNVIRYSIYAFHMPLFIGLTGYLVNANTLKQQSLIKVFNRYWFRVILPFAVAFTFYTGILLVHAYQEARITPNLLLSYLHTPYYHLWFIPTLVIWVFAYQLLLKLKPTINGLLVPSLIVFAILTFYWASVNDSDQLSWMAPLVGKKVVYFFLFFLFGAWLKTERGTEFVKLVGGLGILSAAAVMLCAIIYLFNIGVEKSILRASVWLIMNLMLIALCLSWALNKDKKSASFYLSAIGKNSLPIYLWHAAPLFLLKGFDIHQSQPWVYYLISVVTITAIVLTVIKLESKSRLLDRFVYGIR